MCHAPFRKETFWDVSHLPEHRAEYRATYDDREFAKVFYEWGFGFGVPHGYDGKTSVGHAILAVKARKGGSV